MADGAAVFPFACGAVRFDDNGVTLATCSRQRDHTDQLHRGAAYGTGALVSWSEDPEANDWPGTRGSHPAYGAQLDETTGTWSDIPLGPHDGAKWAHALDTAGAAILAMLALLVIVCSPAVAIIAYRAAL